MPSPVRLFASRPRRAPLGAAPRAVAVEPEFGLRLRGAAMWMLLTAMALTVLRLWTLGAPTLAVLGSTSWALHAVEATPGHRCPTTTELVPHGHEQPSWCANPAPSHIERAQQAPLKKVESDPDDGDGEPMTLSGPSLALCAEGEPIRERAAWRRLEAGHTPGPLVFTRQRERAPPRPNGHDAS